MTEREPLIVLDGVTKDYESGAGVVRALKKLDLVIEPGEFVAIVGTSGSGKSTLMNILGCLDRPTTGTYALAGVDVGGRSNDARAIVRNRLIGFVFQGFNLLPRTTAQENVELPLQYRGVGLRAREKKALWALDAVGLADRVHHTPNQLSGGQQQRVAIARALVTDPPLLLADEPTGNLDTRTSLEVLALLQRLNREVGITIALVTHEHDIAACAKRILTFRDGIMVSDVRQEAPLDAVEELERLPPEQAHVAGDDEAALDPAVAARRAIGGPVPAAVFFAMFGAGVLGAVLGNLYTAFVLHEKVPLVPVALGVLAEAWVAARYGRRAVGRVLTSDQRARVALYYTVAVAAVAAPLFVWKLHDLAPKLADRLVGLSSAGVGLALASALGAVLALSLLRYLLITLFSPRR